MAVQVSARIKVADEVWLATALLHVDHPRRDQFAVGEIVEQAREEAIVGRLRPGVYVHATQHCVSNRPPSPARYRMLYETGPGMRRLYRAGDPYHPGREGGKMVPERDEIPPEYHRLLDWYDRKYAKKRTESDERDSILELRGLGKGLWANEDPDSYVKRLREGWE